MKDSCIVWTRQILILGHHFGKETLVCCNASNRCNEPTVANDSLVHVASVKAIDGERGIGSYFSWPLPFNTAELRLEFKQWTVMGRKLRIFEESVSTMLCFKLRIWLTLEGSYRWLDVNKNKPILSLISIFFSYWRKIWFTSVWMLCAISGVF